MANKLEILQGLQPPGIDETAGVGICEYVLYTYPSHGHRHLDTQPSTLHAATVDA